MKRIVRLALLACLTIGAHAASFTSAASSANAATAEAEQLQQAIVTTLLLQDSPRASHLGARVIRLMYADNEEMTDSLAERLLQLTVTEPKDRWIGTAVGQIQMLGQLRNTRYRDVLRSVQARTTNEDVKVSLDEALKEIGEGGGTAYKGGAIDLNRRGAAVAAVLASGKRLDRSAFDRIGLRTDLIEVLSALGAPDSITAWPARSQKITLHYAETGIVLMAFAVPSIQNSADRKTPPRLLVQLTAREQLSVAATYKGANYGVAQTLGSVGGRAAVQYFKSQRRFLRSDMDAMYILVRRLLEAPYSTQRYDEALFEIAIVELWRSPDPRAMEWVRMVANMPGKNATKKVAAKIVKSEDKRIARGLARQIKPEAEAEAEKDDDGEDSDP